MVVTLPKAPPYAVDDLDDFPSDGNRYELIEGTLHVSAAPSHLHQRVLRNLAVLLDSHCPPRFEVLFAPLEVAFTASTSLQPDALVIPAGDPRGARLREIPLLVIEVLSPSNRHYDLGTKRPVYRESGVPAFWAVDPHEPSITEWRWDGDRESERTTVGDEPLEVDWPFPVSVVPARLTELGGSGR